MSARRTAPFVVIDCGALSAELAEAELFGHVKGAFTDAREDSQGYFRAAEGGVLFLDEIGEMPMGLQAKLLRAVEYHEVQPVGSTRTYSMRLGCVRGLVTQTALSAIHDSAGCGSVVMMPM